MTTAGERGRCGTFRRDVRGLLGGRRDRRDRGGDLRNGLLELRKAQGEERLGVDRAGRDLLDELLRPVDLLLEVVDVLPQRVALHPEHPDGLKMSVRSNRNDVG